MGVPTNVTSIVVYFKEHFPFISTAFLELIMSKLQQNINCDVSCSQVIVLPI